MNEAALRARECADQLLQDHRDRLTPDAYARALAFKNTPLSQVRPEAAIAMLRMHARITGTRV